MQYVYILQSVAHPEKHYVGCTNDVDDRLARHNSGYAHSQAMYTATYRPWKVIVQIGFEEKARAFAFEKYLKSGSGRAFAKKHF